MTYRCARCGFLAATSPTDLCWRCAGEERLGALQRAYLQAVHQLALRQYPHPDHNVLHPPAACRYCADIRFLGLHELRARFNIAYSGELAAPGGEECPSEAWRPPDVIERWPGNRPAPPVPSIRTG